jgi:NDP-sugar pyrophosphorylase family protein
MKGAIIAAGWGERLGQKIPKALTQVGGRALIEYALAGFQAAGVDQLSCIVNEAARAVPEYVESKRLPLKMDWIVQTTPSSMHSFLIVLERLSRLDDGPFLIATVDSVCPPQVYAQFARQCALFPNADVCLGLTKFVDDEKPLRVAMSGSAGTGILPSRLEDDPEAYEIIAMTNNGFDSAFVTSGFYFVRPSILKEKEAAVSKDFTALRQYLGHLLKYGYRFYGVPLPDVVDVDRAEDIHSAEQLLSRQSPVVSVQPDVSKL